MNKLSSNYSIPNEFPKILHDYGKAVILYNPKDIIDFSYKYFYCLENGKSLSSMYSPKASKELSNITEINSNQKETVPSIIDQIDKNIMKDKEEINNGNNNKNEIIEKNDSKKITSSNNNSSSSEEEEEEEDDKFSNNLEDSTILLPISKEMAEVIRKRKEEEKKIKIDLDSTFSKLSESDSQKQGVKDFVSDLFFESDDKTNENYKK